MSSNVTAVVPDSASAQARHPKGLYVLFGTEMWERFSFYSMLALFTLYLRDPNEGFGWTSAQATTLYANYLMFVYISPLVGGFIADKFTGYRKAVMIGGFFFMAGHGLLSIPAVWAVYAALTCLVIGNGFFKPNVSTMVGNLYPEGSSLKDRAYNIFYMGINIGAFIAPITMEYVKQFFGFHAAFAVAAFGMVISVAILWFFKNLVEEKPKDALIIDDYVIENIGAKSDEASENASSSASAAAKAEADASTARQNLMNSVPDWKRVLALCVVFLMVIVFWMVFHQNGSTLTYWADDNTAWKVSGTISNSINAFWVVTLTFPLIWFWGFLDRRGKEPSTPTKMAFGMTLTGLSFLVLWYGATLGEGQKPTAEQLTAGEFRVNERVANNLKAAGVPEADIAKIMSAKDPDGKPLIDGRKFSPLSPEAIEARSASNVKEGKAPLTAEEKTRLANGGMQLLHEIEKAAPGTATRFKDAILQAAFLFRVSPFWLIFAYAIVTLGELMLSPMGLSLVSKVAPLKHRGLLMGGWFLATAIGNKLTQIGIFWDIWLQSTFFLVLACMALFMAVVLFLILKPLKKAMPGV